MRGLLIALIVVAACEKAQPARQAGAAPPPARPTVEALPAPPPAQPPAVPPPRDVDKPTLVEVPHKAETLGDAIDTFKPEMKDTYNELNPGAARLALWASEHAKWADFALTKNETGFGRIKKDPDAERGKRMCIGATIVQIERDRSTDPPIYAGLLVNDNMDIVRFFAVGSTGDLVEKHDARLCGVVTGVHSYDNAAGGTGHAVELVGMFDIPENTGKRSR